MKWSYDNIYIYGCLSNGGNLWQAIIKIMQPVVFFLVKICFFGCYGLSIATCWFAMLRDAIMSLLLIWRAQKIFRPCHCLLDQSYVSIMLEGFGKVSIQQKVLLCGVNVLHGIWLPFCFVHWLVSFVLLFFRSFNSLRLNRCAS